MSRNINKKIKRLSVLFIAALFFFGAAVWTARHQQKPEADENRPITTITPEASAGSEVTAAPKPTISQEDNTDALTPEPVENTPTAVPDETAEESVEQKLQALISSMTLTEKIGQLFFIRCPGRENAAAVLQTYMPAGMVLFASDFETESVESMQELTASYQAAANIPLLLAVDEEGGTVTRISRFSAFRKERFASPQELFAEGGMDAICQDTEEKAQLLFSLGINMNLAPVCDISTDETDYMYARSFGQEAAATADFVQSVVTVMKQQGIVSTLKHFPGYGNNENTHTGIANDFRSYESFSNSDFLPFQAGIEAGADCVLVSHNIVHCMDSEHPASLSQRVHEILRDDLSFQGVIMTDDLSMDAITLYTDGVSAAVAAILCGNDLLITSDYETQIPAVYQAVTDGTIREEQIEEAVLRVLKLKYSAGLLTL